MPGFKWVNGSVVNDLGGKGCRVAQVPKIVSHLACQAKDVCKMVKLMACQAKDVSKMVTLLACKAKDVSRSGHSLDVWLQVPPQWNLY